MNGGERHITDEILVKYLLGEASDAELLQVQQWLMGSEDNKKYFAGLKLIWNESRMISAESNVNTDEAWERFLQRTQAPTPVARPVFRRWARIAATLLLLAGGSWLAYFAAGYWSGHTKQSEMAYRHNPVNERISDRTMATGSGEARETTQQQPGTEGQDKIDKKNEVVKNGSVAQNNLPVTTSDVQNGAVNKSTKDETSESVAADAGNSNAKNAIVENNAGNSKATNTARSSKNGSYNWNGLKPDNIITRSKKMAFKAMPGNFMQTNRSSGGLFKYDKGNDFICNKTPCPIEICIIQTVKCADGEPSAISTCSLLEPDESGQLRYKTFDKVAQNCQASIDEIRIKQVGTGETIVLNANSKPATAQEFFSYITGEKKGDITAGMFHTDCNNNKDDCGLMFDNSNLILH